MFHEVQEGQAVPPDYLMKGVIIECTETFVAREK